MANLIKVAITHSIQTLYSRGWSKRRIARELGLDRETVARYIRIGLERESNPAISTAGSPDSTQPFRPPGNQVGQASVTLSART